MKDLCKLSFTFLIILSFITCNLSPKSYMNIEAAKASDNAKKSKTQSTKKVAIKIKTLSGMGDRGSANGLNANVRFYMPEGIVHDNDGGLYVLDTYNNLIRYIKNGRTKTIAGQLLDKDNTGFPKGDLNDGKLKDTLLNRPTDGVVNSKGELYIVDSANNIIRVIKNGIMYTFCGTKEGFADGKGKNAQFNRPSAIAIDSEDNIYVADTLNNCIRMIDTKGTVTTIAGNTGEQGYLDGEASKALFNGPSGIAVSEDGRTIYVADTGNHRIRMIKDGIVRNMAGYVVDKDTDGDHLGGFADKKVSKAMFNMPIGLTLADNVLIIADKGNNRIRAIKPSGKVVTVVGGEDPGDVDGKLAKSRLHQPIGVYYHKGTLYIADTGNNKIKTTPFDVASYQ